MQAVLRMSSKLKILHQVRWHDIWMFYILHTSVICLVPKVCINQWTSKCFYVLHVSLNGLWPKVSFPGCLQTLRDLTAHATTDIHTLRWNRVFDLSCFYCGFYLHRFQTLFLLGMEKTKKSEEKLGDSQLRKKIEIQVIRLVFLLPHCKSQLSDPGKAILVSFKNVHVS